MKMNVIPAVYTRREAAAVARMGITTLDEAIRRGDFLAIRIGHRVLLPRAKFERALGIERSESLVDTEGTK